MAAKHSNAESGETQERWLPVVGYEGLYEVSDRGRVRSLDRKTRDKRGRVSNRKGVILSDAEVNGYHYVNLSRDGGHKGIGVHRLVAGSFIRPIPDGMVVNHIDNEQTHNHLSNLEIITVAENNRHAGAFYKRLRAEGVDIMDYYRIKYNWRAKATG